MHRGRQLELPTAIDEPTRAAIAYCLGLLSGVLFELDTPELRGSPTRSQVAGMILTAASGAGVTLAPEVRRWLAEHYRPRP